MQSIYMRGMYWMPILKKIPKHRNSQKNQGVSNNTHQKIKKRLCIGFDITGKRGIFKEKPKRIQRNHSTPWNIIKSKFLIIRRKCKSYTRCNWSFLRKNWFSKTRRTNLNSYWKRQWTIIWHRRRKGNPSKWIENQKQSAWWSWNAGFWTTNRNCGKNWEY